MKRLSLTVIVLLVLASAIISCTPSTQVAKLVNISVSPIFLNLWVELEPTDAAQAGKIYIVDLYEKGKLRSTSTVSWSVPELNVRNQKGVPFPLTTEESSSSAYGGWGKDLSNIFSVKVHE